MFSIERTDFLVRIIELLRFHTQPNSIRNHHTKFELERTNLTCLN